MRDIRLSCIQHEHALHRKQDYMSMLREQLTCLLYYILYCFSESICPTRLATTSCSTEHHTLVLTSKCVLVWSAVNCIDSLPVGALTHHYNHYTIFYIVNGCSRSQHYFNLTSNSSKWKSRINLSLADAVNNILGTFGASLGKNKIVEAVAIAYLKIPFLLMIPGQSSNWYSITKLGQARKKINVISRGSILIPSED